MYQHICQRQAREDEEKDQIMCLPPVQQRYRERHGKHRQESYIQPGNHPMRHEACETGCHPTCQRLTGGVWISVQLRTAVSRNPAITVTV
jgi:hypothetical protein